MQSLVNEQKRLKFEKDRLEDIAYKKQNRINRLAKEEYENSWKYIFGTILDYILVFIIILICAAIITSMFYGLFYIFLNALLAMDTFSTITPTPS